MSRQYPVDKDVDLVGGDMRGSCGGNSALRPRPQLGSLDTQAPCAQDEAVVCQS